MTIENSKSVNNKLNLKKKTRLKKRNEVVKSIMCTAKTAETDETRKGRIDRFTKALHFKLKLIYIPLTPH